MNKRIKSLIFGLISLLALGGCNYGITGTELDTYSNKIESVVDLGLVRGLTEIINGELEFLVVSAQ